MTDADFGPHAWRLMVERALHRNADALAGLPVDRILLVAWHFAHSTAREDVAAEYTITPRRGERREEPLIGAQLAPIAELPGVTAKSVKTAMAIICGLGLLEQVKKPGNGRSATYAYRWPAREALDIEGGRAAAIAQAVNLEGKTRDTKKASARNHAAAVIRKEEAKQAAAVENGVDNPTRNTSPHVPAETRHDVSTDTRHDVFADTRHDVSPFPIGGLDNRETQCGSTSPGPGVADAVAEKDFIPNASRPLTERANAAARPLGLAARRRPHTPPQRRSWAVCPDCAMNRRIHDDAGRCRECHDRDERKTA